jgi:cobalt/nickel transport system permease protein
VILWALHIPDGFMSLPVATMGWLLALPALALALRGSQTLEDRFVPVAGLLAAFVFAAQTLQFPVPGGTSGHLVGSSLVTILLGPWMGMVVLSAVLLLEAVVFGTGGLLALGWNAVNMVVVMGLVGAAVFHVLRHRGAGVSIAAFCSAWLATQFGSLVTCLELAAAGTSPLEFSLPAMMATQALVGVGEGLVTSSAVVFLWRTRPDLVPLESASATRAGFAVLAAVTACSVLPPSVYGMAEKAAPLQRYPGCAVCVVLLLILAVVWALAGLGRTGSKG